MVVQKIKAFLTRGSARSVLAKKNIFYSFFLQGGNIFIGLLLVPILLDYLDPERYGIWLTLTSIVGWFTFFDAGLGNGLRNNLTAALANGNVQLAKEYVSTTYAIIALIFCTVLLIFYIINPALNWQRILNTKSIPANELTLLALIVFTFFFLRFIFNLIGIILMADQRPAINNSFVPLGNIISLTIIYILTLTTQSNLVLASFVLSATPVIILLIASVILFGSKYSYLKPKIQNVKWMHAHELFGLGIKFFIIQISALLIYSTSNVIIAQFLGTDQVAVYNIAFKYFQMPIMLFGIIMLPIWSAVTDAFVKNDYSWLKGTLSKLNRISCLFFLGIGFMLLVSPFTYDIWLGKRVHIPFTVSASLALYAAISIFIYPYSSYINGFGKLYIIYRLVIIISLLYIPFAIILVKTPLHVAGVAIASCVLSCITAPVYIIQTNKIINGYAKGIWEK